MTEKLAFSIDELAEIGPICRSSIFQAIREGKLIAQKIGRRTIVTREAYQKFLQNLPLATEVNQADVARAVHAAQAHRRTQATCTARRGRSASRS